MRPLPQNPTEADLRAYTSERVSELYRVLRSTERRSVMGLLRELTDANDRYPLPIKGKD